MRLCDLGAYSHNFPELHLRDLRHARGLMTRVASSHIRIGTFEYASLQNDTKLLQKLADYSISRHFPDTANVESPYLALFAAICNQQASLIANWMSIGFIHGVMNTDNMSISGETIDYGPCAFMNAYNPKTVFSSIDAQGRYAYQNQPSILTWNLTRLAEALIPLVHDKKDESIKLLTEVLQLIKPVYPPPTTLTSHPATPPPTTADAPVRRHHHISLDHPPTRPCPSPP